MYESFFALKEKPFSLTPNPRFLFLSKTHNEVYAHLIFGIESRAGFVEVTGEVGTGKTTILRTLLSHLDEKIYRVAFIFNPKLTAFELLRNINREFGVADDGLSSPDLIRVLNEFLLAENRVGRTPILVIDEAQNLSGEVLEQIRLLSNLETEEDKLIQVVLVGQPELRHHLSDHSLRQLNQRIAVRYQLHPLNREETEHYILHRLNIAGRPDGNIFSPAALKKIFQCSGGIPRKINLICDRTLLTAYSEERRVATPRNVIQAVKELTGLGEERQSSAVLPWKAVFFAIVLILAVLAGISWLAPFSNRPVDATILAKEPARQTLSGSTVTPVEATDSLVTSCNALFSLWDAPELDSDASSAGFDLDREFALRGFELVRFAGRFDALKMFNTPMLLPLPEDQGGGYLSVLTQTAPDEWSVSPLYQGRETLSTEELNGLGLRMVMLPWIDFASIGYIAAPGEYGENVRRLQFLLGLNGCTNTPTNGRYDAQSIQCVKDFQLKHGLVVDGLVGPRTLILLYQAAGAYNMPRMSS
jgi:general secretion pathway protein A